MKNERVLFLGQANVEKRAGGRREIISKNNTKLELYYRREAKTKKGETEEPRPLKKNSHKKTGRNITRQILRKIKESPSREGVLFVSQVVSNSSTEG